MKPLDLDKLQSLLCESLCAHVRLHRLRNGWVLVDTPMTFPDGDGYSVYLQPLPGERLRLTDHGHTLMQMSYEMETDRLREGNRAALLGRALLESGIDEREGVLYLDVSEEDVGAGLVRFLQAVTRIYDLTYLTRTRVESTFYEDLRGALLEMVPADDIASDYVVPQVPGGENYPIDYRIAAYAEPVFVFGVTGKDKARLVTATLNYLLRYDLSFNSLVIFEDQAGIPRPDLARLTDACNEMVSSLSSRDDLRRKLNKLIGQPRPEQQI